MATLLLSAAGAALGGSMGGSVLGMTAGVIGRAAGATLGAVIDQKLTGLGAEAVETGRVERFRVMGGSEGAPIPRVFGRVRVAGQIIWSSNFLEHVSTSRVGGKGGGRQSQKVREFSYSVSVALALCEGEVARVGRIWADGQRLDLSGVVWRLHAGSEEQLPDPVIAAIEGAEAAPAYRGTAYVVFEDLDLTPFGNRIPQFNFEVFRRPNGPRDGAPRPPSADVRGVALVPGTGEYALATEPVHVSHGKGQTVVANVNNDRGRPDLVVSLEQMQAELPAAKAVSLVVSWFGDDLRCGRCTLQPAVEQAEKDGKEMSWRVAGVGRFSAKLVSRIDGRPTFGGTPSDASVVQAIRHMRESGLSVMFYPFILMDILQGNGLGDPWTGAADQPRVPWRGRITLSVAPGRPGSSDKTAAAAAEVDSFFGTARASHFARSGDEVVYSGPEEWSYRRFILHYAHLCAAAGGVAAFCIGSEMRSLTQIRDSADGYPAVRALRELAADVRSILGPDAKIGYAADWSEYFGHQPGDGSGDAIFHLDPLWAHPDIDFVGIDNYMPLSDWRDGDDHLDAPAGSIYDLDYLRANVAGGEGYDWYYGDRAGRDAQVRLPIVDGAHGEHWIYRYKDIRNWWANPHHDRVDGVRRATPTAWSPCSKPIWFTELGCPAVDKGTNQPNVFSDPKSSESFVPYYSSGAADEFIQHRYLQAMYAHWNDPAENPVSPVYGAPMVDMSRAFVWAWDARPWPDFPDRLETWVDGLNYHLGHWIDARVVLPSLGEIVAEVADRSGLDAIDVSGLHGCVTGYQIGAVESGRQSLQPLMLAYGFDSRSEGGNLAFAGRDGRVAAVVDEGQVVAAGKRPARSALRAPNAEALGRAGLEYVRADFDYQTGAVEAVSPDVAEPAIGMSSLPIVLAQGAALAIAERWLAESRVARESVEFELPPSRLAISAGDTIRFEAAGQAALYRVDRLEDHGTRAVTAVRIEPAVYRAPRIEIAPIQARPVAVAGPVHAEFLDLPLLTGQESPHAPHVAVTKTPWAGSVAVYSAPEDFGYELNREILRPATMGETLSTLPARNSGVWTRDPLRVRLASGVLNSAGRNEVLNGANAAAIRSGSSDWEVIQFADAVLVGPREYLLRDLLRGQAGTDGVMPAVWPAGSDFVLLDAAVAQLELPAGARGLDRHYRIGPALRGYDDASYLHVIEAFRGVGLRPYRPTHLSARRLADGGVDIRWVRRTRVEGDSWEGAEAPLGEDRELYSVTLRRNGAVLRTFDPTSPRQVYSPAEQASDGGPGRFEIEVAQVSDRYGPGPGARLLWDG